MESRRAIGIAVVIIMAAAGIRFGSHYRASGVAPTGENPVTIISVDAPGVPVRVLASAPTSSIPVDDQSDGKPLPSRGVKQVMARRDMALVAALAGKGPPEQNILGDAMMTQDRDPARAAPVEAAMQVAFGGVPALVGAGGPARVTCVNTTCEVSGVAASGQSAAAVEQALRDPALLNAMVARGYTPGPVTVGSVDGSTKFVMYLNNEM